MDTIVLSLWPKHPPVLFPQERDAFTKITQTKLGILTSFKDRFHDIGCKRGQLLLISRLV